MKFLIVTYLVSMVLIAHTHSVYAHESPDWPMDDCFPDEVNLFNKNEIKYRDRLVYYLDSKFLDKMQQSDLHPSMENVTPKQIEQTVIEGAEIWNAESRGPALVYGGRISYALYKSIARTAKYNSVFIRYSPTCRDGTAGGECTSDAIARAERVEDIPRASLITFWGVTRMSKDDNTAFPIPWRLTKDEGNGWYWLRAVLVHELGHVLGLAHPDTNGAPDVDHRTVMHSIFNGGNFNSHLWNWEKSCVYFQWGHRTATPRSIYIDHHGGHYWSKVDGLTSKGSLLSSTFNHSGYSWFPYFIQMPPLFYMHNGMILVLSSQIHFYREAYYGDRRHFGNHDEFWRIESQLNINPVFTYAPTLKFPKDVETLPGGSQYLSYGYYQFLMLYNKSDSRDSDPPRVSVAFGNANEDYTFTQGTGYLAPLLSRIHRGYRINRSHIPPSVAYDPISGETIFASVDTTRVDERKYGPLIKDEGGIRLRLFREFKTLLVGFGEYVHKNIKDFGSSPPDVESWEHNYKTYFAASVACADRYVDGYNCIVAWVDRGISSGNILYTWFRVSGGKFVWSGVSYRRKSATAQNHVSVGFFQNRMWLAYKDTERYGSLTLMYNDLSYQYGYWYKYSYNTLPLVDAPSIGVGHLFKSGNIVYSTVKN